jgi:Rieske Fe-S protein
VSQPEQFPTPTPSPEAAQGSPLQRGPAGGIDRRTVLRTAGVVGAGAVGAATLAACGSSSDTSAPASSPAAGSAEPAAGAFKAADIPVGGGKVYDVEKVVVTQPKAGEFKAFSAICTHKGCTVAKVENGTIDCKCHGSKFDMTTGAVKAGPAQSPLPAKTAKESGGSITLS